MKKNTFLKTVLIATVAFIFSANTNAQSVELTGAYGYHFGSKLEYGYNNYIKINDGDQYSLTLGVDMFKGAKTEVTWVHQSTDVTRRYQGNTKRLADLNADWIMVGVAKYIDKDKLTPFAGAGIGAAIFNPSNENREIVDYNIDTKWYLGVSLKAGANYMFNENWGLNVQGNLMFPVQWGGVYIGTGGGGVSGSSTTLIGGFSGGLVYRTN